MIEYIVFNCILLGFSLSVIVLLIIFLDRMRRVYQEMKQVRNDLRRNATLKSMRKEPYEVRLKREYEKRGLPWETIGKS